MCTFKHIRYMNCDCRKRHRISTCLAAFQQETSSGDMMPSCRSKVDDDLPKLILPGICGICQRYMSGEEICEELENKIHSAAVARNDATEELFQYLSDEEPAMTGTYDESISKDGKTVARILINGIEVLSGHVTSDVAKNVVRQAASLHDDLIDAWGKWTEVRRSANPDWRPPAKLENTSGIRKAYSHWFKAFRNAAREMNEAHEFSKRWDKDHNRIESYREARHRVGDVEDSIRGHLPYVEKALRTAPGFPKPPSPLRHELKVEDLVDSDHKND